MPSVINPSSYFFSLYSVPTLIVSTLILAVGFFVFSQNRKSPSNVSFFVVCICINFWLYGISLVYCAQTAELARNWYRWVTFLGVSHLSPSIYMFSVLWLGLYEKQKRFVISAYLLAFGFYLVGAFAPFGIPTVRKHFWGFYPVYGLPLRIFLLFFFTCFFAAFYNFFSQLRREMKPLRHKQIKWIAVAFLISLTGSIDYLPKIAPLSVYPFGFLPVFAWILIVAYLIVRYRVMEIQTVIHKTIMWSLTSSLFALPVILVGYFGKEWFLKLRPVPFAAAVFLLIVLFSLYGRFVQPMIDHFFQRRRWDLARAFEVFTDQLVHLRSLEDHSEHILSTIRKVFYVQAITIFSIREETGNFECVQGLPEKQEISFERKSPFLAWLEKRDILVVREFIEFDPRYEGIRDAASDYFDRVNASLCLPLIVDQRLLGIVNIGQKANLKRFGNDEITFLSDLRKTAAIALSNTLRSIEIQESLRRWNVELERKVEERTRELKQTQAQLIQAEKLASIGTLAGGVAHEINNPLTAVLTNVQMLKMMNQIDDPESLSLIEEGAKRCQSIIQKLMRYARKTEEIDNYVEVDINRVIQSVSDFLGYQLKQENIEVRLSLGALAPVAGIANELEQVFTNLILNAKDAIKLSGRQGRIEIKTNQRDGLIQIELSDNGVGIKKENLARVFDPFYTTKDVGEGTGLGLTVTSGIIEKHLGKISVNSLEGSGTTFFIQFPSVRGKGSPGQR